MKLSEFVKETLVEIAEGAKQADERYNEMGIGGRVNPYGHMQIEGFPYTKQGGNLSSTTRPLVKVSFNLKVQLEEREELEGGIKGILSVISAGVGASKENHETSVQEISFEIPVVLPCGEGKRNCKPSEPQ